MEIEFPIMEISFFRKAINSFIGSYSGSNFPSRESRKASKDIAPVSSPGIFSSIFDTFPFCNSHTEMEIFSVELPDIFLHIFDIRNIDFRNSKFHHSTIARKSISNVMLGFSFSGFMKVSFPKRSKSICKPGSGVAFVNENSFLNE